MTDNYVLWKNSIRFFLVSLIFALIVGAIIPYLSMINGYHYPITGIKIKILIFMTLPATIGYINSKCIRISGSNDSRYENYPNWAKKILLPLIKLVLGSKNNPFLFITYETLSWYMKEFHKIRTYKKERGLLLLTAIVFIFVILVWSSISILMLILLGLNATFAVILFLLICAFCHIVGRN